MDLREILGLSADATDADVIAAAETQGVVTTAASQAAANSAAAAARRNSGGGAKPTLDAETQKELDGYRKAAKAAKLSEAGNNLVKGIHGIVEGKTDRFMNTYLKDSEGNWVEKVTPEIMENARKEEPSWFDASVDPFTGKKVEVNKTTQTSTLITGGPQTANKNK